MSSTSTILSRNVFAVICNFLSEKSILELRQVSKSANDIVCSFVLTRRTKIDYFSLSEMGLMGTYARKTKIIFEIHNRRNLFLWRLYIIQALHLLDLNLIDALFLHYISDSLVKVGLTHEDAERFLEYLKPSVSHTKFGDLHAKGDRPLHPKTIQLCTTFLDGKNLRGICLNSTITRNAQVTAWIYLLQKVRCVHVAVKLDLNRETLNSMIQLANMVASLTILASGSIYTRDIVVLFIKAILQRKCKKLHFSYRESPISVRNVETLLNFISHLNKKISLTVCHSSTSWNAQVGNYKLSSSFYGLLSIKHVEN